jgi:acetylornithine deacetylase/succinyl-diaminopimelate desuccinylase-like protein
VWFLVEVYGKQAHGSTPWLGLNAFVDAFSLSTSLQSSMPHMSRLPALSKPPPKHLGGHVCRQFEEDANGVYMLNRKAASPPPIKD